jgi:alpha-L-arabinofuranosidase
MYAPYFTGYRQSVNMPAGVGELVDIVAVLSEKGDRLAIGFINRSLNEPQTVSVNLRNFAPPSHVTLMRMEAARFDAINTFSNPDAVQLRKESVPWRTDWVLPAHSVSVLLLEKR